LKTNKKQYEIMKRIIKNIRNLIKRLKKKIIVEENIKLYYGRIYYILGYIKQNELMVKNKWKIKKV